MLDLAVKKQRKETLLYTQQAVRNWLECTVSILRTCTDLYFLKLSNLRKLTVINQLM